LKLTPSLPSLLAPILFSSFFYFQPINALFLILCQTIREHFKRLKKGNVNSNNERAPSCSNLPHAEIVTNAVEVEVQYIAEPSHNVTFTEYIAIAFWPFSGSSPTSALLQIKLKLMPAVLCFLMFGWVFMAWDDFLAVFCLLLAMLLLIIALRGLKKCLDTS
jgi:hypothetical protein